MSRETPLELEHVLQSRRVRALALRRVLVRTPLGVGDGHTHVCVCVYYICISIRIYIYTYIAELWLLLFVVDAYPQLRHVFFLLILFTKPELHKQSQRMLTCLLSKGLIVRTLGSNK